MTMRRRRQMVDQQSRVLHELSSLLSNVLRSPPSPIELFTDLLSPVIPPLSPRSSLPPPVPARGRVRAMSITPAGFALLMLGISMSLMLSGSLIFIIGLMLMPWVLGLFMVLYLVGFISSLSVLGRSILCCVTSATAKPSYPEPSFSHKDIPAWKLM